MPTYEYKCEQCGDRFEYFQSMTSERLTTCKKCGGKLRRLIGEGSGIIFKGSGFYCTDYKGANASLSHEHEHSGECGCHNCAEAHKCEKAAAATASGGTK